MNLIRCLVVGNKTYTQFANKVVVVDEWESYERAQQERVALIHFAKALYGSWSQEEAS